MPRPKIHCGPGCRVYLPTRVVIITRCRIQASVSMPSANVANPCQTMPLAAGVLRHVGTYRHRAGKPRNIAEAVGFRSLDQSVRT